MKYLLFGLLKVLEVLAVVFIPYWLGKFVLKVWLDSKEDNGFVRWMFGIFSLAVGVLIIPFFCTLIHMIIVCIPGWLELNWIIVNKILG